MSRLTRELGHEVFVANPTKLRLMYDSDRKRDRADAEYMARAGRMDPTLLAPVSHRGEQVQANRRSSGAGISCSGCGGGW